MRPVVQNRKTSTLGGTEDIISPWLPIIDSLFRTLYDPLILSLAQQWV